MPVPGFLTIGPIVISLKLTSIIIVMQGRQKTGFTPSVLRPNSMRNTMKRSFSEAQHALQGLGQLLLMILCSSGGIIILLLLQFFYRRRFLSFLLIIFSIASLLATLWLARSAWHGILIVPLFLGFAGILVSVIFRAKTSRHSPQ